MGYKKCAAILKQRPAVHDVSQLEGVRGIGKSIRDKIQEILESGGYGGLNFINGVSWSINRSQRKKLK